MLNVNRFQFYIILNVAVGSTAGYMPDGALNRGGEFNKPWHNSDGYELGMHRFWEARNDWEWTWDKEGDNVEMQVDYIRVYQWVGENVH